MTKVTYNAALLERSGVSKLLVEVSNNIVSYTVYIHLLNESQRLLKKSTTIIYYPCSSCLLDNNIKGSGMDQEL